MNITQISIDLAKNVFQVCCLNQACKPITNRKVSRRKLVEYVDRLPRVQLCMEACYSAHYWGRRFGAMGFDVCLIPAQHVKPFVMGNKNDQNDAVAIAEASRRPRVRFVPVKPVKHQDLQMSQRIRERAVKQRTALVNQTRGFLSEYGIIAAKGRHALVKRLPEILEGQNNGLTDVAQAMFWQRYEDLQYLNEQIAGYDAQLIELCQDFENYARLMEIPGIGPKVAASILGGITDIHHFANGRQLAAYLGLTPRHSGSGERTHILSVPKRTGNQLKTMFIHAARSAFYSTKNRDQNMLIWADRLRERRPANTTLVALAHKIARIVWAILSKQSHYLPNYNRA